MSQPTITLPSLAAAQDATVSGLSAGGFMTGNMFTIFSSTFSGAGIVAGNPWACRQLFTKEECKSTTQDGVKYQTLVDYATTTSTQGLIDPVSNIKGSKIWLFSGTKDQLVSQATMNNVDSFYKSFGADIKYVTHVPANHCFPTDYVKIEKTHPCGHFGSPFINYCNFDGVGDMLGHILPAQSAHPLRPKVQTWKEHGALSFFTQAEFFDSNDDFAKSNFADKGYVYIPNGCHGTATAKYCRVHMALHGCWQGQVTVGETYIIETGYLHWAAANHIIMLFPQMGLSSPQTEYEECWVSWGSKTTLTKSGLQAAALKKMVDRVQTQPSSVNLNDLQEQVQFIN